MRYDECPHEYHDELHSHEANRQLKPQMRLNFADDPIRATALRWWKESDRSDRSSSRPENRLSNIPLMCQDTCGSSQCQEPRGRVRRRELRPRCSSITSVTNLHTRRRRDSRQFGYNSFLGCGEVRW